MKLRRQTVVTRVENPETGLMEDVTSVRLMARLDEVMLDPANARKHGRRNLDDIKASLSRYTQQTPVVIDKDAIVIKGNGTTSAARELGWEEIWVEVSGLDGVDRVGYAIADNRTGESSEWDDTILARHLEACRSDPDFDVSATGFSDPEVDELLERLGKEAAGEKGDGGAEFGQGEKPPAALEFLKWDDFCVPLTEEEREALAARYAAHMEANGTPYGFVNALLGGI